MQNQLVLNAGSTIVPYEDFCIHYLYGKPKKGQNLTEVESLIVNQIDLIKNGEFDEWLIEAVINDYKINMIKSYESNYSRARAMSRAFIYYDNNWAERIRLFDKMMSITKKDIIDFVDQYSEVSFDSVYRARGQFNNEYADILFGLEIGQVFGPYRDGKYFKISRLLDRKKNASLRASHILITYKGASRASDNITRSKEEAKIEANRVLRIVRRGKNSFEELATEYSDGPSYNRGGDIGFFQEGQMAQQFFKFVNKNKI